MSFEKSKVRSTILFVLALMSKETAIVIPALLFILYFKQIKKKPFVLLPIIIISATYLYLRFKVFGLVAGDSYGWDFSPFKAANTLMWYILWSFGAPELLVDYVGSGLRILPRFFTDYPVWSYIILSLLGVTLTTFAITFISKIKNNRKIILIGMCIFLITIFPVIFLPAHKFTLELGLPLVGFSVALAALIHKNIFGKIFLFFFIVFNLLMWPLTYSRSYAVNRGPICKKIITILKEKYPTPPAGYFEFINDTADYGASWGSSKQIFNSCGGSEIFRVFYRDKGFNAFFQDFSGERPLNKTKIEISTRQFYQ